MAIRYGGATESSGVVRILKDLDMSIEGRDVLVVEDIIDSGLTLSYLDPEPRGAGARLARDLRPADEARAAGDRRPRPVRRLRDPNRFVVGYGLDFDEKYRNLPYVGVLDERLPPP